MFFAACEGYYDKLEDNTIQLRNLADIMHRSLGGKTDIQNIWPLHNDPKKERIPDWTAEEIDCITRNANQVFAQTNKIS